jgi:hypothetical protein
MGEVLIWTSAAVKKLANAIEVILGGAVLILSGIAGGVVLVIQDLAAGVFKLYASILEFVSGAPEELLDFLGMSTAGLEGTAKAARDTAKDLKQSNTEIKATIATLEKGLVEDVSNIAQPFNDAEIAVGLLDQRLEKMKIQAAEAAAMLEKLNATGNRGGRTPDTPESGDTKDLSKLSGTLEKNLEKVREMRMEANAITFQTEETFASDLKFVGDLTGGMFLLASANQAVAQSVVDIQNIYEESTGFLAGLKVVGVEAAQALQSQFGSLFSSMISGSKSMGDALLEALMAVIQTLATHFAQLFFAVAAGLQAATTLGPVGLAIAAAALVGLALGVSAIMGGGEEGGAPVANATIEPVQRQTEQEAEQERGGRVTFIFNGIATDDRQVAKAIGELVGLAEEMNVWAPSR